MTFIDDFSRYVVVYYIENKSEVTDRFIKYKALMENQLSKKIKRIRTDNERYTSTDVSLVYVKNPVSCIRRRYPIRHNKMGLPNA